MNIHIKDEDLLKELIKSTIYSIPFGSKMYGLEDKFSDTDFLCIYIPKNRSCFENNHQLQYKDLKNNVDCIFVDIYTFINNLITGDSTINFEIINFDYFYLNGEMLNSTFLHKLYLLRSNFNTFNIARAYLGLANRDLKQISKCKDEKSKQRKLLHIRRGISIASNIINFEKVNLDFRYLKKDYNSLKVKELDLEIKNLRNYLKELLNKKEIVKYLEPKIQLKVDKIINETVEEFKNRTLNVDVNYLFYPYNENSEFKYE